MYRGEDLLHPVIESGDSMHGRQEEQEHDSFARGDVVALHWGVGGDLGGVKLVAIASAVNRSRQEPGIIRDASGGGGGR